MEVPAGTRLPAAMLAAWETRPPGYGVCLDFPQSRAVRRWSAEAKARRRRSNLERRIQKAAPLFADELVARELERRPDYFDGK